MMADNSILFKLIKWIGVKDEKGLMAALFDHLGSNVEAQRFKDLESFTWFISHFPLSVPKVDHVRTLFWTAVRAFLSSLGISDGANLRESIGRFYGSLLMEGEYEMEPMIELIILCEQKVPEAAFEALRSKLDVNALSTSILRALAERYSDLPESVADNLFSKFGTGRSNCLIFGIDSMLDRRIIDIYEYSGHNLMGSEEILLACPKLAGTLATRFASRLFQFSASKFDSPEAKETPKIYLDRIFEKYTKIVSEKGVVVGGHFVPEFLLYIHIHRFSELRRKESDILAAVGLRSWEKLWIENISASAMVSYLGVF
jgi:hypothetical protein